jgi:dinuclear metal center YbgI/SA1388 family protein
MAKRDELIAFCDRLLEVGEFQDYGPNGLQVPGAERVELVASAVSIDAAVAMGADLLIAHHGLFWDFHPRSLSDAMSGRLKAAFAGDLSIAGYHLPLDAHPEIGNNVLLACELGFQPGTEMLGEVKGRHLGAVAHREDAISAAQLFTQVEEKLGRAPLVFAEGPDEIRSIGVITGAGASDIHQAISLGLDAFITGEPAEHVMADAREGSIHFVAAGHYASETLGIRRLGDMLSGQFGIEHQFIDVPNPI